MVIMENRRWSQAEWWAPTICHMMRDESGPGNATRCVANSEDPYALCRELEESSI